MMRYGSILRLAHAMARVNANFIIDDCQRYVRTFGVTGQQIATAQMLARDKPLKLLSHLARTHHVLTLWLKCGRCSGKEACWRAYAPIQQGLSDRCMAFQGPKHSGNRPFPAAQFMFVT